MTDHLRLDLPALASLGVSERVIAERAALEGDGAVAFLAQLPDLVRTWQHELGLRGARLLPGGVMSAAFACRMGEEAVVLKLSSAHGTSARAEAAALEAWAGVGACRLLFAEREGRVMLLAAIRPGRPPEPRDQHHDAERAARLLELLHRPMAIPEAIPEARQELDWRFRRAHDLLGTAHAGLEVSHEQIEQAHRRALRLDAERPRTVLCHGDFLDKNILVDDRDRWWAIDPRPCRGDPCLDAAFWALAHRGGVDASEHARLVAARGGLDPERVTEWMRAFAIPEAVLALDPRWAVAYLEVAGRTRRSIR